MKNFIYSFLFFTIPIVILGISAEFLLRKIPNDYSSKNQYLTENSNEIETLFLGNSHVYFAIDPKFIKSKSYNASHISQSLDIDEKMNML